VPAAHACREEVQHATPDLVICARVMGDAISDAWYRCPRCGRWSCRSVRESITTGEHEAWHGPLTDETSAPRRALISQCGTPSDERCPCAAHRAYFGPSLDP
jgi:hypothetical protein